MSADERGPQPSNSATAVGRRGDSASLLPAALTSAVRSIVNAHEIAGDQPVPRRIAVTSALHGEGVTTVSQTLAAVLADDFETPVCWVDLSWMGTPRRTNPKKAKRMGQLRRMTSKKADRKRDAALSASRRPGIIEHLAGEITLSEAMTLTNHDRIDLLRAGVGGPDAQAVSPRSKDIDRAMRSLERDYEFIVIDLPPVLGSSAALPLFRFADAYLLVTRSGVTRTDQVSTATGLLDDIPQLGTVLNHDSKKVPRILRRLGAD